MISSSYYPFGLKHKGYNGVVNSTNIAQKKKFAGEEFEDELGKNTVAFQWRDYDPAIGRFGKIDRFAEKYKNNSPYGFSMNNPILNREIAGDSISLISIMRYDKKNNTNYTETILNSLSKITGLELSVDEKTGQLTYVQDEEGNEVVNIEIDANGDAKDTGSYSARQDLMKAIDNKKTSLFTNFA